MSNVPHNNDVAGAYDRWAATYDVDPNKTRELAAAALRRADSPIAGRSVIEIGCGTGGNTGWLAEQAASVLALDFSAGMLKVARDRVKFPHVRFVEHDIRTPWPAGDSSADVVVSMLVLEHVEQIGSVLREAARVLRPHGDLFLCELHPVRQMMGGQAEFTNSRTGKAERIAAFLHDASEYVNEGIGAGFALVRLGEWRDAGAGRGDPPRILSAEFRNAAAVGAS
jgi:malonyl-CoA O-methyltransferase